MSAQGAADQGEGRRRRSPRPSLVRHATPGPPTGLSHRTPRSSRSRCRRPSRADYRTSFDGPGSRYTCKTNVCAKGCGPGGGAAAQIPLALVGSARSFTTRLGLRRSSPGHGKRARGRGLRAAPALFRLLRSAAGSPAFPGAPRPPSARTFFIPDSRLDQPPSSPVNSSYITPSAMGCRGLKAAAPESGDLHRHNSLTSPARIGPLAHAPSLPVSAPETDSTPRSDILYTGITA